MPDDIPGLVISEFGDWLSRKYPEFGRNWTASLIEGGRSNLTYLLANESERLVLRRPPLGHVLATAHDMQREARVMSALAGRFPVPEVIASVAAPESVLGVPFTVTRFVEGSVLRDDAALRGISGHEARARSEQLIDALAQLHSVEITSVGLEDFGRPHGFLERNVNRWCTQWESNQTRTITALDDLGAFLRRDVPPSPAPAILHGDFRLDNTILSPTGICAVVDWEMSTLGDPLTDLALMCCYWSLPEDVEVAGVAHLSSNPGFLKPDELLERYSKSTGIDLSDFPYYAAYAVFKLAVILEGINARFQAGQTVGAGFETMSLAVDRLADWGQEFTGAHGGT